MPSQIFSTLAIFTDITGTTEKLLQEGDPAPGFPGYAIENLFSPVINDADTIAFDGQFPESPDTRRQRTLIWTLKNQVLAPLVAPGQPAPGFDAGVAFTDAMMPRINNADQVLFVGNLSGPGINSDNSSGLWLHDGTGLRLIAQQGAQAAGAPSGVTYSSFAVTRINGAGDATFLGWLSGPGVTPVNRRAVWTERNGNLEMVARAGEQAPDLPLGVTFGQFQDFVNPELTVNAAGQLAIGARLAGPGITDANNYGIWATDLTGAMRLIVRNGDQFDVNDDPQIDDFRTISASAIAIAGSGGEDGWYTSFNDAGELAVTLQVADGSAGVFVFNTAVPEPSALMIIAFAAVAMQRVARRRVGPRSMTGN